MEKFITKWLAEDTAKLETFARTLTKPDDIATAKRMIEILKSREAYTCDKEDFVDYCIAKGIRRDRIEYVWDLLRGVLSVDQLADKYGVELETIYSDRWRYRKKLSKTAP